MTSSNILIFFLQPEESFGTGSLVLMASVVIVVAVILICLCACCHYCMLKNSSSNSVGSTTNSERSSISSMDMEVDDTFNSRKTPYTIQ